MQAFSRTPRGGQRSSEEWHPHDASTSDGTAPMQRPNRGQSGAHTSAAQNSKAAHSAAAPMQLQQPSGRELSGRVTPRQQASRHHTNTGSSWQQPRSTHSSTPRGESGRQTPRQMFTNNITGGGGIITPRGYSGSVTPRSSIDGGYTGTGATQRSGKAPPNVPPLRIPVLTTESMRTPRNGPSGIPKPQPQQRFTPRIPLPIEPSVESPSANLDRNQVAAAAWSPMAAAANFLRGKVSREPSSPGDLKTALATLHERLAVSERRSGSGITPRSMTPELTLSAPHRQNGSVQLDLELAVETDKLQLPGKQAAGELGLSQKLAALRSEQVHLGATLIVEQGANAALQAELTSLRRIQHASATSAEVDSANDLNQGLSSPLERVQKPALEVVDAASESRDPATDFERLARLPCEVAGNPKGDSESRQARVALVLRAMEALRLEPQEAFPGVCFLPPPPPPAALRGVHGSQGLGVQSPTREKLQQLPVLARRISPVDVASSVSSGKSPTRMRPRSWKDSTHGSPSKSPAKSQTGTCSGVASEGSAVSRSDMKSGVARALLLDGSCLQEVVAERRSPLQHSSPKRESCSAGTQRLRSEAITPRHGGMRKQQLLQRIVSMRAKFVEVETLFAASALTIAKP